MQSCVHVCMYDYISDNITHPLLRTYKLFKTEHCLETYLTSRISTKYRNTITRFRVSSHNLEIEQGRHAKPKLPTEERVCTFCDSNSIGDEIHFLTQCKHVENERNHLYLTVNRVIPNIENKSPLEVFKCIMISENQYIIRALGNFLVDSIKKRNL